MLWKEQDVARMWADVIGIPNAVVIVPMEYSTVAECTEYWNSVALG